MIAVGSLFPDPPYNFPALLNVLQRYPHPYNERAVDGAYYRLVDGVGWQALVRVREVGSIDAPDLEVELIASRGRVDHVWLLRLLIDILAIEEERGADRAAFFDFARRDPRLWQVVEPVVGLPLTRSGGMWPALVQAILEQQNAWRTARRSQAWLAAWGGWGMEYAGQMYHSLPAPGKIAAATVDDLKPLKTTHGRIQTLINIAGEVAAGRLALEEIGGLPCDQAARALMQVKGIGRWSAAVILGRAVGCYDTVTDNDVALQAAVNWYFRGETGRIPGAEMVAMLSPYGAYAGLVGTYTLLRWVMDKY